jgi:CheY-like chemotaxis protein
LERLLRQVIAFSYSPVRNAFNPNNEIMQRMFRHILLVEDDTDERDLILGALRTIDENIKVTWAGSGTEALNLLGSKDKLPECIFMDIHIPKMNAVDWLKRIKKDASLHHIPVVILSTAKEKVVEELVKETGAAAMMKMPMTRKTLIEKLTFYLHPENIK